MPNPDGRHFTLFVSRVKGIFFAMNFAESHRHAALRH